MSTPLWSTVADLLESVSPFGAAAEMLRIDSLSVDLPMEVTFRQTPDGLELHAAPPRWRLRTAFDPQVGRMRMEIGTGPGIEALDGPGNDGGSEGDDSVDAIRAEDENRSDVENRKILDRYDFDDIVSNPSNDAFDFDGTDGAGSDDVTSEAVPGHSALGTGHSGPGALS